MDRNLLASFIFVLSLCSKISGSLETTTVGANVTYTSLIEGQSTDLPAVPSDKAISDPEQSTVATTQSSVSQTTEVLKKPRIKGRTSLKDRSRRQEIYSGSHVGYSYDPPKYTISRFFELCPTQASTCPVCSDEALQLPPYFCSENFIAMKLLLISPPLLDEYGRVCGKFGKLTLHGNANEKEFRSLLRFSMPEVCGCNLKASRLYYLISPVSVFLKVGLLFSKIILSDQAMMISVDRYVEGDILRALNECSVNEYDVASSALPPYEPPPISQAAVYGIGVPPAPPANPAVVEYHSGVLTVPSTISPAAGYGIGVPPAPPANPAVVEYHSGVLTVPSTISPAAGYDIGVPPVPQANHPSAEYTSGVLTVPPVILQPELDYQPPPLPQPVGRDSYAGPPPDPLPGIPSTNEEIPLPALPLFKQPDLDSSAAVYYGRKMPPEHLSLTNCAMPDACPACYRLESVGDITENYCASNFAYLAILRVPDQTLLKGYDYSLACMNINTNIVYDVSKTAEPKVMVISLNLLLPTTCSPCFLDLKGPVVVLLLSQAPIAPPSATLDGSFVLFILPIPSVIIMPTCGYYSAATYGNMPSTYGLNLGDAQQYTPAANCPADLEPSCPECHHYPDAALASACASGFAIVAELYFGGSYFVSQRLPAIAVKTTRTYYSKTVEVSISHPPPDECIHGSAKVIQNIGRELPYLPENMIPFVSLPNCGCLSQAFRRLLMFSPEPLKLSAARILHLTKDINIAFLPSYAPMPTCSPIPGYIPPLSTPVISPPLYIPPPPPPPGYLTDSLPSYMHPPPSPPSPVLYMPPPPPHPSSYAPLPPLPPGAYVPPPPPLHYMSSVPPTSPSKYEPPPPPSSAPPTLPPNDPVAPLYTSPKLPFYASPTSPLYAPTTPRFYALQILTPPPPQPDYAPPPPQPDYAPPPPQPDYAPPPPQPDYAPPPPQPDYAPPPPQPDYAPPPPQPDYAPPPPQPDYAPPPPQPDYAPPPPQPDYAPPPPGTVDVGYNAKGIARSSHSSRSLDKNSVAVSRHDSNDSRSSLYGETVWSPSYGPCISSQAPTCPDSAEELPQDFSDRYCKYELALIVAIGVDVKALRQERQDMRRIIPFVAAELPYIGIDYPEGTNPGHLSITITRAKTMERRGNQSTDGDSCYSEKILALYDVSPGSEAYEKISDIDVYVPASCDSKIFDTGPTYGILMSRGQPTNPKRPVELSDRFAFFPLAEGRLTLPSCYPPSHVAAPYLETPLTAVKYEVPTYTNPLGDVFCTASVTCGKWTSVKNEYYVIPCDAQFAAVVEIQNTSAGPYVAPVLEVSEYSSDTNVTVVTLDVKSNVDERSSVSPPQQVVYADGTKKCKYASMKILKDLSPTPLIREQDLLTVIASADCDNPLFKLANGVAIVISKTPVAAYTAIPLNGEFTQVVGILPGSTMITSCLSNSAVYVSSDPSENTNYSPLPDYSVTNYPIPPTDPSHDPLPHQPISFTSIPEAVYSPGVKHDVPAQPSIIPGTQPLDEYGQRKSVDPVYPVSNVTVRSCDEHIDETCPVCEDISSLRPEIYCNSPLSLLSKTIGVHYDNYTCSSGVFTALYDITASKSPPQLAVMQVSYTIPYHCSCPLLKRGNLIVLVKDEFIPLTNPLPVKLSRGSYLYSTAPRKISLPSCVFKYAVQPRIKHMENTVVLGSPDEKLLELMPALSNPHCPTLDHTCPKCGVMDDEELQRLFCSAQEVLLVSGNETSSKVPRKLPRIGKAVATRYLDSGKYTLTMSIDPPENSCQLPMKEGNCSSSISRYYYDAEEEMCTEFSYSGCKGNANNFASYEQCEETCLVEDFCEEGNLTISVVLKSSDGAIYQDNKFMYALPEHCNCSLMLKGNEFGYLFVERESYASSLSVQLTENHYFVPLLKDEEVKTFTCPLNNFHMTASGNVGDEDTGTNKRKSWKLFG